MEDASYRAGGHDWLATWRRMYDDERDQAERATPPEFTVQADFWAGQSKRVASIARQTPQPDGFMRFLLPRLRPDDRVLDIGAGAGRYEPSLAAAVADVLALEPSPAMRERLAQRMEEEQVSGVRVIAGGWPDTDVPPCEVAISAHVLYGVREIGPFLLHMNAVARRACFLALTYRHPLAFMSPFWERLYGEPRLMLPGALECLCALFQLGIPAQMALVPGAGGFGYGDRDEALADIRWRLRRVPDPDSDRAIARAIDELLVRDDQGRLSVPGAPERIAVIWWEQTSDVS